MDENWAFKEIRDPECRQCSLHHYQEKTKVCLVGQGPRDAELCIVGEAPGAREQDLMRPFSGRSGKLLDATLERVGLNRNEIFITNTMKCRTFIEPSQNDIETCYQLFLKRELEIVKPKYILLLGKIALSITGRTSQKHNVPFQWNDTTCIYTLHPAACLRQPSSYPLFLNGLETAHHLLREEELELSFTLVDNWDKLREMIKYLRSKPFSFDLETETLEPLPSNRIFTISFSDGENNWVLPLEHPEAPWRDYEVYSVTQVIKPLLESDSTKTGWNVKFDIKWLNTRNIYPKVTDDGMILAHLINEEMPKSLESQIGLHIRPGYVKTQPTKGEIWSLDKLSRYTAEDVFYSFTLWRKLSRELPQKTQDLYHRIMIPTQCEILPKLERTGIGIDLLKLSQTKEKIEGDLADLKEKMDKTVGKDINWNSSQQVSRLLYEELKLPVVLQTNSGFGSTSEWALTKLKNLHPVIPPLLEWKKKTKYLGYITSYQDKQRDSRLYPSYNLCGTVSGRLSSSEPNLHQVPRDNLIRNIFSAPPGYKLIEGDLEQAEARIIAFLSGDDRMRDIFIRGADIHLETAHSFLGEGEISREQRKRAKAVNFGLWYGLGVAGLRSHVWEKYQIEMSEEEASRWRDAFFRAYPKVPEWHERTRETVIRDKMIMSPTGRIRHLMNVLGDEDKRSEAIRQAINFVPQSMASDIILLAVIQLDKILPKGVNLVGLVHDCLLYEAPDRHVDNTVEIIKYTLENPGIEMSVPIKSKVSVFQNWTF